MPIIRVGVQANRTSEGQIVSLGAGGGALVSITNVSGEDAAFSLNGGVTFTTVAANSTVAVGATVSGSNFRLRRAVVGGYPISLDVSIDDVLGAAPVYTGVWAGRPAANSVALRSQIVATDFGSAVTSAWYSDGTNWRPVNGSAVLAVGGMQVILPSSGSSNATGQITFTTPLVYNGGSVLNGPALIYLPAGVVVGDAVGGMRAVTFTASNSVCQIVGSPATANTGYTQTTAEVTLLTVLIQAGSMGLNGALVQQIFATWPNNANSKTILTKMGSSNLVFTSGGGSNAHNIAPQRVWNMGVANRQITPSNTNTGVVGSAPNVYAVDTAVNQNWTAIAQLAVATDYIVISGYSLILES